MHNMLQKPRNGIRWNETRGDKRAGAELSSSGGLLRRDRALPDIVEDDFGIVMCFLGLFPLQATVPSFHKKYGQ